MIQKTSAIQKPSKIPKIEHSPPDACETCVETSEHLKKVMKRVEILQNLVGKLRKDNWILEESEVKKTEELNKEKEKNQELQKTILKLNGENEANRRVIQQFKDRITAISSYEDLGDPPLVYDCLICSNRIKSDEEYARCPLCNRIFHSIVIVFSYFRTEILIKKIFSVCIQMARKPHQMPGMQGTFSVI